MPTLLRIDSSAMGSDASISRHLTSQFVEHWLQANPGGRVIPRDLAETDLPLVTADWIGAAYSPNLTPEQQEKLAVSNELIAELEAADEYVIGVPMYNFSIPAVLKLWID